MAYIEVSKNGKVVTRRHVDEQKAQKGCKFRLGSAGEVHLTLGKTETIGEFTFRLHKGDIPQETPESKKETSESQDMKKSNLPLDFSAQVLSSSENKDTNTNPEIEGYRIIKKLGRGGMGVVWLAEQLGTKREVALKLMVSHADDSNKAKAKFQREVELTARLEHPNIASIYDSGLHHGMYYYAMEYIDGLPLDKFVKYHNLTRKPILKLMYKICTAVLYAHQRAVIHRDLKPSNIMVDEEGEPHILDFGLAKALLDEDSIAVSMEGQIAGTPAYMSPEQASGIHSDIDTRSDVFSLGVILYELLTGESPHDLSGSMLDVLHNITEGNIQRPSQINKNIDSELEAIILKALSLNPDERYASAGMLGMDIKNYLDGEPIDAHIQTTLYFLRKKTLKYKKQVAILVAAMAIIFAIIISAYTRFVRQRATLRAIQEQNEQLGNDLTMLKAKFLSGDPEEIEAALTALEQKYQTTEQEYQHLLEKANLPTTNTLSEIGFYFDKPVNLGEIINSSKADGTLSISTDGLEMYFSSNRAGCIGDVNSDIWVARRETKQDPWGNPSNLGAVINSTYADIKPRLSPDGLALYFVSDRPGGYGNFDIYESRRIATKEPWSEPKNLGEAVNSSAFDTDPSISADNLTLYFASKRGGGYGGIDIWRTTRKTTKDPWKIPVAMATEINSQSQDEMPYISSDGLVLLFSSNRPGGYGGSDIYLSRRKTTYETWSKPVNLGTVVNSRTADISPFISTSGSAIFFSSTRSGGYGGLDIWQVPISTTDSGFTCEPARGQLLAYYPFDENAQDVSGNGWHGSEQGGILTYEKGKYGQAISLSGNRSKISKQYILTKATASMLGIEGNKPKTICAWVYTRAFNNGGIFDIGDNSNEAEFCLLVLDKINNWKARVFSDYDINLSCPSQNIWIHFAIVYDGQKLTVYANGKPAASRSVGLNTMNKIPFQIGISANLPFVNLNYFNGLIDDVQIYNYALTQSEVKTAMTGIAQNTPFARISPEGRPIGRGLVAYYPLDGDARDYTGNGFNGEIQGRPTYKTGKIGRAISLNEGTDQAVYTEAEASVLGIQENNPKTVCAWVFTKEFNHGAIFNIGMAPGQAPGRFSLQTNAIENSWRVQIQPQNIIEFNYPSENIWVHFALVYNGNQLIVYANGLQVVNQTIWLNTNNRTPFQIGRFLQAPYESYFNGLIDEVRIYNYALTQAEVKAAMAGVVN